MKLKVIIAATDGSEGANRALAFAADLAKSNDAKLLIVNVSEIEFSKAEIGLLDRLHVTEGDALEQISLEILTRAREVAQNHSVVDIQTMSGGGNPARVLIKIAEREHADAIVVGRRGRGQLEGLLLGSVSQKLSCLAPCTIIIVPHTEKMADQPPRSII